MTKTLEELIAQINEQMEIAFNNITNAETPEMVKYWQGVFHNCQYLLEEKEEVKSETTKEESKEAKE